MSYMAGEVSMLKMIGAHLHESYHIIPNRAEQGVPYIHMHLFQ